MDILYYLILDLHDAIGLTPLQLTYVIVFLFATALLGMAGKATR